MSVAAGVRRELQVPKFLRISQLVPDDQDLVTVPVGARAGEALRLMRAHQFDQLPVMTADGHVVGAFTYRSFTQGLQYIRAQGDPLTAPVDDLLEDLRFVRAAEQVGSVLGSIESDNAVLVGDEHDVVAIVTIVDVSRFLWRRTSPFVLLEDIELAVRDLMQSSCAAQELADAIVAALPARSTGQAVRLEDLTLGELLTVLLNGTSFGKYFRLRFGDNRQLVRTTLEPVRDIRNKVFHFRGEVSAEELQSLLDVTAWLRRKVLIRGGAR